MRGGAGRRRGVRALAPLVVVAAVLLAGCAADDPPSPDPVVSAEYAQYGAAGGDPTPRTTTDPERLDELTDLLDEHGVSGFSDSSPTQPPGACPAPVTTSVTTQRRSGQVDIVVAHDASCAGEGFDHELDRLVAGWIDDDA